MAAVVTATTIVPDLLDRKNYEDWSVYMKNYLMGQHLWSIVEHGIPSSSTTPTDRSLDEAKNAAALHAIHITCSPDIFARIRGIGSAKEAWEQLARIMMMHQSNQWRIQDFRQFAIDMNMMTSTTVSRADYVELRRGMWKGEWDVVCQFLNKYPLNTIIKEEYDKGTVLHLAILAGQAEIAEKLVEMMSITDLRIQCYTTGDTALYMAAWRNLISVAKCLVQKHPELLTIPGEWGLIPVTRAAIYGHEEMTRYLYSVTPLDLLRPENGVHGFKLMCTSISSKMFDISLDLLLHNPHLAINFTGDKELSPILKLSTEPSAFYSGCRLSFWQRWIYQWIKVKLPNTHESHGIAEKFGIIAEKFGKRGIQEIYDLKLNHYYALRILRLMCNSISTLSLEHQYNCGIYEAAFEATKRGTYEFFIELRGVLPSLVYSTNGEGRNVHMLAIQHRQENVLNLFSGISETIMVACRNRMDNDHNTILHMAGELAPTFKLSRVSGAALKMQRELQWFKEVEKITPSCNIEAKNIAGLTARQVFTESHEKLLKDGEKWMKDTAQSFIIVGTLIVTIMFAVAFTVPGGNDQNTGFPIFLGEKAFKIFLISDAVSFFAASTSILMFLGILATRYAEEDFLVSLPTKLIIGLSMLFISTAAMMVSFSTTLLIMLRGQWWSIIPIVLMASIPVTLFVWLQFPLLVRIFMSTYGSGIFGKKVKVHPQ